MPISFYKAGWLLSSITLLIVSLMATITALWLVEIGKRTALIATSRQLLLNQQMHADEHVGDALIERQRAHELDVHRNKCYEVNEIVEFHLGLPARRFYELMVLMYMLGALWSYASVFAASLASNVPVPFINGGRVCDVSLDASSACNHLYLFYIAVVAAICVPLSCMELTEMKAMGIILALFRFISLTAMMATSVAAIWSRPLMAETSTSAVPVQISVGDSPPYYSDLTAVVWRGLGVVFPISIYAQIFHHSVPGLSQPVRNKSHVPIVFMAVVMTTCVLYCLLGFTVGLYFGSAVKSTCTLNWSNYAELHDHAWWATLLGYTIVLFPPIDIISAFPLNAITLGNNMLTCFVHDPIRQKHRPTVVAFRLIAVIPPLIGACFVHDLASILQWTGFVGVSMAFIYPTILQYKSAQTIRLMAQRHELQQQAGWRHDKSSLSFDEAASCQASINANRVLGGPIGKIVNSIATQSSVLVFSVIGLIVVVVLTFVNAE